MNISMKRLMIRSLPLGLILVSICEADARNFQDENANRKTSAAPRINREVGTAKITTHPRERIRRSNRRTPPKQSSVSAVSLLIVSSPPNSKLFINSEPRGETDANGEMEVSLAPGTYMIRVTRDGYIAREAEVEILPAPTEQQVEFTLPSALTSLNIVTDPPGAEVYLDDMYKGTSGPNGLLVLDRVNPSQPHTLRARKDGYIQQSTPVTSYTGQVSIKLLTDSLRLKVSTDPPESEVYLDEVYKGTSTSDGVLVIDQVNPNQIHTVRGKKEGFKQQSAQVSPGSAQVTIKLSPDPIVLLVRDIKDQVAQGRLREAFESYNLLAKTAPDHQDLSRLLESVLQGLQVRSTDTLKQVGYFGLFMELKDAEEMNQLYGPARKSRATDETIDTLAKYWNLKYLLAQADRTTSVTEKQTLRVSARSALTEITEHNLRNPYLFLDLGWSWWKLDDKMAALKQFKLAQELRPDWAYPHFALGFLATKAAENEREKSVRTIGFGQALDSFAKAISLKHDFATAYAYQAVIYTLLKKKEQSISTGLQAVAVDPQSAYAHFALGFAYFEKGKSQYRDSLNELNRALTLGGPELDEGTKSLIQQRLVKLKKSVK